MRLAQYALQVYSPSMPKIIYKKFMVRLAVRHRRILQAKVRLEQRDNPNYAEADALRYSIDLLKKEMTQHLL